MPVAELLKKHGGKFSAKPKAPDAASAKDGAAPTAPKK